MRDFEDIKKRANKIADALDTDSFAEVFDREFDVKELCPADLMAVHRLSEVYNQVKTGTLSRQDGTEQQREIFKDWKRDIH